MEQLRILNDLWPLILSVIALIVWLVRLEGRATQNAGIIEAVDKRVDVLSAKHEALDSKTIEQLSQVRESLARIEGALGVKQ